MQLCSLVLLSQIIFGWFHMMRVSQQHRLVLHWTAAIYHFHYDEGKTIPFNTADQFYSRDRASIYTTPFSNIERKRTSAILQWVQCWKWLAFGFSPKTQITIPWMQVPCFIQRKELSLNKEVNVESGQWRRDTDPTFISFLLSFFLPHPPPPLWRLR